MREFIKYALLVINIISLVIGLVFVLFFLYCEFFGYIKGNNLLKWKRGERDGKANLYGH